MNFKHAFKTPFAVLFLASNIFLFYIVLFPFKGWAIPEDSIAQLVIFDWLDDIFLFDIVQNLLLFLPFGLFAGCDLLLQRYSKLLTFFIVCLGSFSTSLFIEILQTFNPVRIPSLLDVSLNTISGFIGVLLAPILLRYYPTMVAQIKASVLQNSYQNPWAWLGIMVWLTWAMFQLYPFIPTLHPNQLLISIAAILQYLRGELEFSKTLFIHYCMLGTVLYFTGRLFIDKTRLFFILLGFLFMVFIGKVSVVSLVLEPECLAGCILPIFAFTLGSKIMQYITENIEVSPRVVAKRLRRS
jgi:glycopeptide antibiotics resistance protein